MSIKQAVKARITGKGTWHETDFSISVLWLRDATNPVESSATEWRMPSRDTPTCFSSFYTSEVLVFSSHGCEGRRARRAALLHFIVFLDLMGLCKCEP